MNKLKCASKDKTNCKKLIKLLLMELQKALFTKILTAVTTVEFSFNIAMQDQINGAAMNSPLDPGLANTFVGCYEKELFQQTSKPVLNIGYVDDTFPSINEESNCGSFATRMNSSHPCLTFTCD